MSGDSNNSSHLPLGLVDVVDSLPNGFGERCVALAFFTCSVFVAVVEHHLWRG